MTYSKLLLVRRFALGLSLGVLAGWLVDNILLGVSAVVFLYLLWTFYQLFKLLRWLETATRTDSEPPESVGLWGAIFDAIYRLTKHQVGSRDRLKGFIERVQESTAALDDGIVMVDRLGKLEWWNRAASDLLGLKYPEDLGQQIVNLVRDPDFVKCFHKEGYKQSFELRSPVNDNCQIQIKTTVYGGGSRLLLIRDITRITQLEIMRKDFIANVSHELRTPLTVISGYVETLSDALEFHPSAPAVWKKALNRMQEQSGRMQALVTDLLLLSKLESMNPTSSDKVNLDELLSQVVSDARALSGDKQHEIQLHTSKGVFFQGNEGELRSALSNLIFNAVRYTQAGGHINIALKVSKKAIRISVEDNGIGINSTHIPRLTERFYRVDQGRSSATGGTGLGLAIVKHVLIRHGGRLSITSELGKGSCFTCHLPKESVHGD